MVVRGDVWFFNKPSSLENNRTSLFDNGVVFEIIKNGIFERRATSFGFFSIINVIFFFPSFLVIDIQKKKKFVRCSTFYLGYSLFILRGSFSNESQTRFYHLPNILAFITIYYRCKCKWHGTALHRVNIYIACVDFIPRHEYETRVEIIERKCALRFSCSTILHPFELNAYRRSSTRDQLRDPTNRCKII